MSATRPSVPSTSRKGRAIGSGRSWSERRCSSVGRRPGVELLLLSGVEQLERRIGQPAAQIGDHRQLGLLVLGQRRVGGGDRREQPPRRLARRHPPLAEGAQLFGIRGAWVPRVRQAGDAVLDQQGVAKRRRVVGAGEQGDPHRRQILREDPPDPHVEIAGAVFAALLVPQLREVVLERAPHERRDRPGGQQREHTDGGEQRARVGDDRGRDSNPRPRRVSPLGLRPPNPLPQEDERRAIAVGEGPAEDHPQAAHLAELLEAAELGQRQAAVGDRRRQRRRQGRLGRRAPARSPAPLRRVSCAGLLGWRVRCSR